MFGSSLGQRATLPAEDFGPTEQASEGWQDSKLLSGQDGGSLEAQQVVTRRPPMIVSKGRAMQQVIQQDGTYIAASCAASH